MLTRILLAIDSDEDRARLRALVASLRDVILEEIEPDSAGGHGVENLVGDLLVISRALLAQPAAEQVARLRTLPDAPEVVVVTHGEDAVERARFAAAGFLGVLDASLGDQLLRETMRAIVARLREEALARLRFPQRLGEPQFEDFVSRSPVMAEFMDVVRRVGPSDATLLLVGETGTGKERLAEAIHAEGPRARAPFVAVNCGAIPEALLESELFGHVQGAFTGATRARRGWFELAHGGTIFLDEIGELPLHLQVKLLRVLQTRQVVPVGSERRITIDVRVMAATNRDLEQEVAARSFRQDLFYRLSVVTLELPPLRERHEDIPRLVEKYIAHFRARVPTRVKGVSREAMDALVSHAWPGNIRELVNVIERAVLLCAGEEITPENVPVAIRGTTRAGRHGEDGPAAVGFQPEWIDRPLREVRDEVLENLEHAYLDALLRETEGRMGEAARRAGINVRNLFTKLRQHGLRKEDYRRGKQGGSLAE